MLENKSEAAPVGEEQREARRRIVTALANRLPTTQAPP